MKPPTLRQHNWTALDPWRRTLTRLGNISTDEPHTEGEARPSERADPWLAVNDSGAKNSASNSRLLKVNNQSFPSYHEVHSY